MKKRLRFMNADRTLAFKTIIMAASILAALFSSPAFGQHSSVREFSLQSAQEFAVSYSYDSQKSRLDIQTAEQRMKEILTTGLPQVQSEISYMNNLELTTMLIPNFFEGKPEEKIPVQFGTQHNANANFTVSQLIFNGSYFVGLQAAKIFRQLADLNFERTKLDILETVTNTYYLILVSEESLNILSSNLQNLEKTHYEIKELLKEGFVAETDADLVQISVTRLKNSLQSIERNIDVAYKLLKFQMGLDLTEEIALTDRLEEILRQIDLEKLQNVEFDLDQNIDFQLLRTQERLSEMDLKNEKMKYLPTVAAFYNFQWNAMRNALNFFDFDEQWYRTQILGLNITVPIFKSGSQKAKVQQAALAFKQAQNLKKQAAEGLELEAARVKADLDSTYDNYVNTKDNMSLSQKVYDATLTKYREGVASSMDLTQAHDTYLASQSEFIQAMSALLTAKNKLDRLNNSFYTAQTKDEKP